MVSIRFDDDVCYCHSAEVPNFRFAPILLQKSFYGVDRKFLEPLMRFSLGDVRGHVG